MPKQKTHKGLAKRIRVSKNGKVKVTHTGRRHLFSSKSGSKRRQNRKPVYLQGSRAKDYRDAIHNDPHNERA